MTGNPLASLRNRLSLPFNAMLPSKVIEFLRGFGAYLVLFAVLAFFSLRSPVFLTLNNVVAILQQTAVLGIAAFGLTAVILGGGINIIEGGIDLSIGSNIGLITGIYAVLISNGTPIVLVILIGLAVGLLIGLINGLAVAYLRILPLLITLATLNIVAGIELLITNNLIIAVDSDFVRTIAEGKLLGIPIIVIVLGATCLFYHIILHRTPVGFHIQAVGGNREAALRAGLRVTALTVLTYVLSGLAAGISSIVLLARLSGSTRGFGPLVLLDILLASNMSAMFSRKWAINIPGTLIGAVFVGVLTNGFTMLNVPTYWVQGVKGLLILAVVAATSLNQKRNESV